MTAIDGTASIARHTKRGGRFPPAASSIYSKGKALREDYFQSSCCSRFGLRRISSEGMGSR